MNRSSQKQTFFPDPNAPLPVGKEKALVVQSMFDAIAPRYDLINRLMTFRLDTQWRRKTVKNLHLGPGSSVIDLACGTGDLCQELIRQGYHAYGFDVSFGMLSARTTSTPVVQADILQLPLPSSSVDGATCGFALRNLVDLSQFFAELGRVIRPGGRIALLDVATPSNPFLRSGHAIYFGKIVPKIGGLLSHRAAYEYLPKSVAYLPEPRELQHLLEDQGFVSINHQIFLGGLAQLYTATRTKPSWK